ncbi:hypothetical protein ACFOJ6_00950 [Gordonia humi]|uniref:hypothetical protein n=1 Tax=Gordonia humi TaxID=686429 RepID=UPI00361D2D61
MPRPDDEDLVVLVGSTDDAVATSTVLESAAVSIAGPVVLRLLVFVPESGVDAAIESAALEGYAEVSTRPEDPRPDEPPWPSLSLGCSRWMRERCPRSGRDVRASRPEAGGHAVGWWVLDAPAESEK